MGVTVAKLWNKPIPLSNPKHILVTGGAGYIGSHACKALAKAGYTPVTYDNLIYGHEWAVQWGPLVIGDIADPDHLRHTIQQYNPEAVMHFAAYAYVGESVQDPAKYYINNVSGTLQLLDVMREQTIHHLIFSSSCATYGTPSQLPITEDHDQNPINPYGRSKWMIETVLADYAKAYGLRSISLRYFNAAGADPDGLIGESHEPETHLIPLVLEAASGKRPYVTIYGDDYDTPDGTCIRDYIHVEDLANAHVLALEALQQGKVSKAYNLGNGNGFSIKEIIQSVERVTGLNVPVKMGPRREGDPASLIGSAETIKQELGWNPRFIVLDDIIKTAWNWHQKSDHT